MFFAHIDQIKKIKFGKSGFEAETKELNELIGKAKVTINELQQIAIVVGSLTLSVVQRSGRIGGYDEGPTGVRSCNSTFVSYDIPMARPLWIKFSGAECMIARPDPLLPFTYESINHYISAHGYKLLHVGQQTSRDSMGNPWQLTVALLCKWSETG